jgi:hypothetical protein
VQTVIRFGALVFIGLLLANGLALADPQLVKHATDRAYRACLSERVINSGLVRSGGEDALLRLTKLCAETFAQWVVECDPTHDASRQPGVLPKNKAGDEVISKCFHSALEVADRVLQLHDQKEIAIRAFYACIGKIIIKPVQVDVALVTRIVTDCDSQEQAWHKSCLEYLAEVAENTTDLKKLCLNIEGTLISQFSKTGKPPDTPPPTDANPTSPPQ